MRAASRAAARFEAEVHEAFVAERIAEGFEEVDAGNIGRVFDAADFTESFRKYLRLHLDRRLIHLLGMDDYEEDILRERIKDIFAPPPPPPTPQKPAMKQIQIGDAEIQQLQQLRAMAARRGRK